MVVVALPSVVNWQLAAMHPSSGLCAGVCCFPLALCCLLFAGERNQRICAVCDFCNLAVTSEHPCLVVHSQAWSVSGVLCLQHCQSGLSGMPGEALGTS
jgi:hypothetical protein